MSARRRRGTTVGDDLPGVRPYVVTEGRVRASVDVRLDTLVHRAGEVDPRRLSTEKRAILHRVGTDYLTVAEVSAHLRMPLGVTQVLVGDLAGLGALGLQDTATDRPGTDTSTADGRHAALDLLESVAHGIADL
ncbi:MAG TPA: DUF742 domain-containing protein [Cellulomonas sp.]